jgi:hypothetical protein
MATKNAKNNSRIWVTNLTKNNRCFFLRANSDKEELLSRLKDLCTKEFMNGADSKSSFRAQKDIDVPGYVSFSFFGIDTPEGKKRLIVECSKVAAKLGLKLEKRF